MSDASRPTGLARGGWAVSSTQVAWRERVVYTTLAALLGVFVSACGPEGARTFSVVLTEPRYLDCFPFVGADPAQSPGVSQIFSNMTSSWNYANESGQLAPSGATLHLIVDGDERLAWLTDMRPGYYEAWRLPVFEGTEFDGYVELSHKTTHETGAGSLDECEVLTDNESVLLATIDGSDLSGRIRRTEWSYLYPYGPTCDAYVECVRNMEIVGSEDR
ncbi:MAG: hypothetical protein IPK82_43905 [Polyangiaceae bacterium]|nr:hypothetical protein [Polyangiaceae bacterium]